MTSVTLLPWPSTETRYSDRRANLRTGLFVKLDHDKQSVSYEQKNLLSLEVFTWEACMKTSVRQPWDTAILKVIYDMSFDVWNVVQLLVNKSQMANAICLHASKGKHSTRTNEMVLVHLRNRPVRNGTTGRTQPGPAEPMQHHFLRAYYLAGKAKSWMYTISRNR